MEDKEFFEESVISNLENFNVFDLSFIEAFRFFYSNYDFELPEDYKAKLLTVLSDYDKVEKDLRLELNDILEILNKYAYLDKYEVENADEINILEQLNESIEIIKKGELVKELDKYQFRPVTSYVITPSLRWNTKCNGVISASGAAGSLYTELS